MAALEKTITENPPAAEPLPTKKSKMPLVMGIVALAAFAVGFLVVHSVLAKGHTKPAPVKVEVGTVVPLDEFLLNSADSSNDHYIKATIAIGLVKGASDDDFKGKIPIARDAIVMTLSSKTLAQLRTPQGKEELKDELRDKINDALGDKTVAAVYLESFATQ